MKTENTELIKQARESLTGKWSLAIGTFIVYILVILTIQLIPIAGIIATLLITGPMNLGLVIFSLSISRNQDAELGQLFEGFKKFGVALSAYLLVALFTLLWMFLLIIPGIIKAISYSMTFYIIADDDNIGAMDAIDKSMLMMEGNKLKYFYLCLRFVGLALLCVITLGIGFLWLIPFAQITMTKFYEDVKGNQLETEIS